MARNNTLIKSNKAFLREIEELLYNEDKFNCYDLTIHELAVLKKLHEKIKFNLHHFAYNSILTIHDIVVLKKVFENAIKKEAADGNKLAVDFLNDYKVKQNVRKSKRK